MIYLLFWNTLPQWQLRSVQKSWLLTFRRSGCVMFINTLNLFQRRIDQEICELWPEIGAANGQLSSLMRLRCICRTKPADLALVFRMSVFDTAMTPECLSCKRGECCKIPPLFRLRTGLLLLLLSFGTLPLCDPTAATGSRMFPPPSSPHPLRDRSALFVPVPSASLYY